MAFPDIGNTCHHTQQDMHIDNLFAGPGSEGTSDRFKLAMQELTASMLVLDRKLDFALEGISSVEQAVRESRQGPQHTSLLSTGSSFIKAFTSVPSTALLAVTKPSRAAIGTSMSLGNHATRSEATKEQEKPQTDPIEKCMLSVSHMTPRQLKEEVRSVAASLNLYMHGVPFHHDPHHAEANKHNRLRLFCDLESAKSNARRQVLHPRLLQSLFKNEGLPQRIATSDYFQWLTVFVVAANALWIAVDVDLNGMKPDAGRDATTQVVEAIFFIYFLFEWVVRLFALRIKSDGVKDSWFMFDGLLVVVASVDMAVALLRDAHRGGKSNAFRLARLVKLIKMGRIAKILRQCPQVLILIGAIKAAVPAVLTSFLVLGLLSYIFAVALRVLTMDTDVGGKYFKSVPFALRELLVSTCYPDVGDLIRDLQSEPMAQIAAIIYYSISVLTLLNLLVGVLVNNVNADAEIEKESLKTLIAKEQLLEVLAETGFEHSLEVKLDKNQFKRFIVSPPVVQILHDVGVDPIGLVEFAAYMYGEDARGVGDSFHEEDEHGHKISIDRLIDLILNLGGSNPATVKDVVDMRRIVLGEVEQMEKFLIALHAKFEGLEYMFQARANGSQHLHFSL